MQFQLRNVLDRGISQHKGNLDQRLTATPLPNILRQNFESEILIVISVKCDFFSLPRNSRKLGLPDRLVHSKSRLAKSPIDSSAGLLCESGVKNRLNS
jgi:hypothetical protein